MIGHNAALKELEETYKSSGNNLVVLYGRDGSEKNAFLKAFLKDKKSFYYGAVPASPEFQLRMLESHVSSQYGVTLLKHTYDECFLRVKSGSADKLVVVIDDFDNIVKKDDTFITSILKLKAKKLYPGPVMILLVTNSVLFARTGLDEVFGENVKKIDSVIEMMDLSFLDVVRAFPKFDIKEAVEVYGILGGVPGYLNLWDANKDVKANVCDLILNTKGALFDEAQRFISLELRELSVYNTILASIASGNEKLNDLFLDTGFSRAKISVYMKNLSAFDVIEKVESFETGGWENAKKGVYAIKNRFVSFWFRFIYPHVSDLNMMEPEAFYDKYIATELDEYLHRYFIEVCREYLMLLNSVDRLPIKLTKVGTWVGKQGTIDIIGQNSVRESIVGICNWEKEQTGLDDLVNLRHAVKQARISADHTYLFSAKTFAKELVEAAEKDPSIVLVDMKEM